MSRYKFKTKITAHTVTFDVDGKTSLSRSFTERLNALGTQRLLNQTTFFHHRYLLQIRFERAIGRPLGKRALMSKGGCFSTIIALSHDPIPFLQ